MTVRRDEADFPYPIETLRHCYLSPFGGRSKELKGVQVGIRREALERNTSIDPTEDRVTLAVLGAPSSKPLYLHEYFEVVPLDETRPTALRLSPWGELVLPEEEWEFVRRPHLEVAYGTPLRMSAAATKLLGDEPGRRLAEIVAEELRRRRST
jgi:hypothetical protein